MFVRVFDETMYRSTDHDIFINMHFLLSRFLLQWTARRTKQYRRRNHFNLSCVCVCVCVCIFFSLWFPKVHIFSFLSFSVTHSQRFFFISSMTSYATSNFHIHSSSLHNASLYTLDIKVKRNEKKCYDDGGRKSNCFSSLFPFQGHLQGKVSESFTLFPINHGERSDVMRGEDQKRKEFRDAYEEVDYHL